MEAIKKVRDKIQNPKVVIIGAGASGAEAANTLIKHNISKENITILEKNDYAGGKLKSIIDENNETKNDIGGVILGPENPVIEYLLKNNIPVTPVLPIEEKCLNKILYNTEKPSIFTKAYYDLCFFYQAIKYSAIKVYEEYNNTHVNINSIYDFTNQNKIEYLNRILKPWVTGMGYGDLKDNECHRIFTYLNHNLLFASFANKYPGKFLLQVKNGYQTVIEAMLKDFNVKTSVDIEKIIREKNKINIKYIDNRNNLNQHNIIGADLLIIATSPKCWESLNMELTDLENKIINNLSYYRYPVAICDIPEYPKNQLFVAKALEKEGFGHIAFITTKDLNDNTNTRRCTVFMNLLPGENDFSLEKGSIGRKILLEDLEKLGFKNSKIIHTKVWDDYNTTIPIELGKELEESQGNLNTIYCTTALPGSFECVAEAMRTSKNIVNNYIKENYPELYIQSDTNYLYRLYQFYNLQNRKQPEEDQYKNEKLKLKLQ